MPGLIHNITIEQGVDFQVEFIVTEPDTGLPFNFTGYTGVGHIFDAAGLPVAEFTVILSAGLVLAKLNETETAITLGRNYTYSIDATHPLNPDYRIGKGQVKK